MKIGSLCSGYGGLDLAVERVFNAETAWFAEYDDAPSKVLAYRWPAAPNHGDMTAIDWSTVEPVDIITGGTPCQDLSHAGKRKGMTEGTRSNLWVQMREAVAQIRPQYVIWENVRGAFSASADSEMEREEGCVGVGGDRPVLRALGRVLGDLSSLGYDSRYGTVRAADAGAPHGRARIFLVANTDDHFRNGARGARDGRAEPADRDLAPADPARVGRHGWAEDARGGAVQCTTAGDHTVATDADVHGCEGLGRIDVGSRHPHGCGRADVAWGIYEPAIRRWEAVTGRHVPAPVRADGRNGQRRLNPELAEWMMGLPLGWITDAAIGLTRIEQLKAAGNGVVPQQAELALRTLLRIDPDAFESEPWEPRT